MILLDTHIWIWANIEPEKLPQPTAQVLDDETAKFGISAVSVWETLVAMQKGRVSAVTSPESTLRKWLSAGRFQVIPLDLEIAALSRSLPFDHNDPADRFIAATAYRLDCPLATIDPYLLNLDWLKRI